MKYKNNLLEVDNLSVSFATDKGNVRVVDGMSFYLHQGKVLGVVGESGSGKSVMSLALMGLLPESANIDSGSAFFDGEEMLGQKNYPEDVSMIFQDPMTALNPCYTVEFQLEESLREKSKLNRKQRRKRCVELLEQVGIPSPKERLKSYPHQLSGGMAQRVMIAMAIARRPKLLIADEPTTALDVTIQSQILELLKRLQRELNMAMILITHDFAVAASQADHILVMYAGQIMEIAETRSLLSEYRHPYTAGLLQSMPGAQKELVFREPLSAIPGRVPDLSKKPSGCLFHPRCKGAQSRCEEVCPPLIERQNRRIKCHFPL